MRRVLVQDQHHQGECTVDIVSGKLHAQHTGGGYVISFDRSTQKNLRSGFERKIARMTAPPRVVALRSLARLSCDSTNTDTAFTKPRKSADRRKGIRTSVKVTVDVGRTPSGDVVLAGKTMFDGAWFASLPADLVAEGADALHITPGQVRGCRERMPYARAGAWV